MVQGVRVDPSQPVSTGRWGRGSGPGEHTCLLDRPIARSPTCLVVTLRAVARVDDTEAVAFRVGEDDEVRGLRVDSRS